ncbi:hypothetical protein ABE61_07445 [Lysinibacillus sphaericus]|nr:hypothetical protein [Lysinibacillus sphaericus]MBG9477341.1 hypothetical protein [Lysinibacillus sphaericus]MBG9592947.1 hypothetical protein [Lysinibacillus sphaericus]
MRVAPFCMVLRQNKGFISVPTGRFVAAASLSLRFRTEQSFLGASDEPLHSLCSLQGLICDADPQGVAQSPLQSTNAQRCIFWHGLIKTKLQQYCLSVRKRSVSNNSCTIPSLL